MSFDNNDTENENCEGPKRKKINDVSNELSNKISLSSKPAE